MKLNWKMLVMPSPINGSLKKKKKQIQNDSVIIGHTEQYFVYVLLHRKYSKIRVKLALRRLLSTGQIGNKQMFTFFTRSYASLLRQGNCSKEQQALLQRAPTQMLGLKPGEESPRPLIPSPCPKHKHTFLEAFSDDAVVT